MDDRDRLIERIEHADDRFLRITSRTGAGPLQDTDLTMRQLKVLLVLSFQDGASGQDLARALGVGLAAVTGITHRLSARGLIRRAVDPHDRRVRRIYLTDKGSATLAVLRDAGRDNKRRLLRRLDDEALRKMADAMDALNAAAEADE
ncbi:MarR family winged helix-turn-helix transcriptional regulator [Kutzneria kofuensis]|uniref:DNA-binding MarR family transcriptional regulator n=1 Tax=Kutzneria kofuensis TaxID=103725 RepID=A0A7W9KRQ3_9PSEU|nr:MarR family transcriptional regulator [Kutzneria kofuensis]MBB5897415.1 DNA-binding MarR family transcriptional regulator [Kutzneria kofuensis]